MQCGMSAVYQNSKGLVHLQPANCLSPIAEDPVRGLWIGKARWRLNAAGPDLPWYRTRPEARVTRGRGLHFWVLDRDATVAARPCCRAFDAQDAMGISGRDRRRRRRLVDAFRRD